MASPALSVVIASRNRRHLLRRCLESLGTQTMPADQFEVVVCDDGSTDGTPEMLDELTTPFELRILRPGQVGRAAARNLAVEASTAPVCLILDDDVIAAPQLVTEHAKAHRDEAGILGVGKLEALPRRVDWYGRGFAHHLERHYAELADRGPSWGDCRTGNLSVPRDRYLHLGGFTLPSLPLGDIELAFRLCRAGCRPRYLPEASGQQDDGKPGHQLLADEYARAPVHVALSDREPAMLPVLLGWFAATTKREAMVRRVALALRLPPRLLARFGPALSRVGRQDEWFEFVHRLAFWLGVRQSVDRHRWASLTHGVPVLMYHAFTDNEPASRYVMPRRTFRRQMQLLRWLGYEVIGFHELAEALRHGMLTPKRCAVITIDDGDMGTLHVAAPALQRQRFPATVFLVSDRFGAAVDWTDEPAVVGRPLLSVDQARQLGASGVSLGAHTRTHPVLPELPDEEAVHQEVVACRAELEERLGVPITVFAYPFGRQDERAVRAVGDAGYVGACTTAPRRVRPDDDPARIPRIEITGQDSLVRFLMRLWFSP
jgi:peptidoglycan/xylan/chitin deacetylase (PgdA/CDA1 family)/glycosyltransferase involved in cell wall biosynthesis